MASLAKKAGSGKRGNVPIPIACGRGWTGCSNLPRLNRTSVVEWAVAEGVHAAGAAAGAAGGENELRSCQSEMSNSVAREHHPRPVRSWTRTKLCSARASLAQKTPRCPNSPAAHSSSGGS